MAYIGNINGPRESQLFNRLGADFFGITQEALEREIGYQESAEARGEVVPVRIDKATNKAYIILSSKDPKKPHHFYLEDNGYTLEGDFSAEED